MDDLICKRALPEKKFPEVLCNGSGEEAAYRQGWNDAVDMIVDYEPSMDAVPVAWIEDEIKEMNEMDNLFSTLTANLLSAMLRRWKEREGNETD